MMPTPNNSVYSNFQPIDHYLPQAIDENLVKIIDEYCKISRKDNPSDSETERLIAILELGEYDEELRSLIQVVDHLIAYGMGLTTSTSCL